MKRIKHTCDDNFFDNINTEEKAYILGLFCADGCNHPETNSISFSSIDKDILDKIRKIMRASVELYVRVPKIKTHNIQYYLRIKSKILSQRLVEMGIGPRKSLTLEYPINFVPLNLRRHFMRGYFDGDGTIYGFERKTHPGVFQYHISFVGTKNFLEEMMKDISYPWEIRKDGKIYRSYGSSKAFVRYMYEYMYDQSSICLQRKKNIFEKAFHYYNSSSDSRGDPTVSERRYDRSKTAIAQKLISDKFALTILPHLEFIKNRQSKESCESIAAFLRENGVPTARGGTWTHSPVRHIMARLGYVIKNGKLEKSEL